MIDAREYRNAFTWDEPINYKGFNIKPIIMKDSESFLTSLKVFTLPKNRSKEKHILKMSYFDYIFYYAKQNTDYQVYLYLLSIFFGLAFEDVLVDCVILNNGDNAVFIKSNNSDNELFIKSQEFEHLRDLILKQNNIELPEPILSEELEKELERAKEIKRKLSKYEEPELEDLIVFLMLYWKVSQETIKNMTIRKFNVALDRIRLFEDFKVYKNAELSGMCEFKEPISDYLAKVKRSNDKYEDVKMSQSSIKDKLKDVAKFESSINKQNK